MNLQDLYHHVITDPLYPYDERLGVAMTEDQYKAYPFNKGHTYYTFLNKLVRRLAPKKVLELGTSQGRSGLFMMTALPTESQRVTVDVGSFLRTDLAAFAYDERIKIVYGNDLDDAVAAEIGTGFDMVFSDSEHTYEHVVVEWEKYRHTFNDRAIVVMDDIHLNEGMERFWNSLKYEKIDTGADLHFSGFGILEYRKD